MWISAYIYNKDPLENLLYYGVKPLVKKLKYQNLIESWFFIRYNTHGNHIRLRLYASPQNTKKTRQLVAAYFIDFYKSDTKELFAPQLKNKHYKPPTLRFVPYRPEIQRYGGPKGIKISEKQFEVSSNTVLELLSPNTNNAQKIGYALQMMYLLYITVSGQKDTFSIITQIDKTITEDYKSTFYKNYLPQKEVLAEYFAKLSDHKLFVSNAPLWMLNWRDNISQIGSELKKQSYSNEELISILGSYIHMNNNRLGLTRTEEIYIFYLLARILEQ